MALVNLRQSISFRLLRSTSPTAVQHALRRGFELRRSCSWTTQGITWRRSPRTAEKHCAARPLLGFERKKLEGLVGKPGAKKANPKPKTKTQSQVARFHFWAPPRAAGTVAPSEPLRKQLNFEISEHVARRSSGFHRLWRMRQHPINGLGSVA